MDEQQPVPTNGGVIAVAGGAAAIVAALVVGLGRSGKDAPAAVTLVVPDELKVTVREAAEQTEAADRRSRELAAAVAELVSAAREEGRAASQAAARESASLLSRFADLGAAQVDVARARERAREALARGGERGIEVTGRAKQRAQRVGGRTAASTQSLAVQAATAVAATSERAREVGSSLTVAAKERAPLVRGRVEDVVVPPVRDAALQVTSTASDLWQSAKDRAAAVVAAPEPEPEKPAWRKALDRAPFQRAAPPPPRSRWQAVRERATHLDLETPASRAAQILEAGGGRARHASTAVAAKATAIGGKASAIGNKATAIGGKAGAVGGKAKAAPGKVVAATVHTGQDTAGLILWGGAAAGLALYALMPPDVREQVLRAAGTASTQVRELVRDFRGYDDEF